MSKSKQESKQEQEARILATLARRIPSADLSVIVREASRTHEDANTDALIFSMRAYLDGAPLSEAVRGGCALAVRRLRERQARMTERPTAPETLAETLAEQEQEQEQETPGMTHEEACAALPSADLARLRSVVARKRFSVAAVARATGDRVPTHKASSDRVREAACTSFALYSVARHPLTRRGETRTVETVARRALRYLLRARGVAGMAVWQQGVALPDGVDAGRVPFLAPLAPLGRSLPDPLRDGSPTRGADADVAPRIGMTSAGSPFERGDRERARDANRKQESNEAATASYAALVERGSLCSVVRFLPPLRLPVCRCGSGAPLTLVLLPSGDTAWQHASAPCSAPLVTDGVARCGCGQRRGVLSDSGAHRRRVKASKSDR